MEWWVWLIIYITIGILLEIIFAHTELWDDESAQAVIIMLPIFWGAIVPLLIMAAIILGIGAGIAKLIGKDVF